MNRMLWRTAFPSILLGFLALAPYSFWRHQEEQSWLAEQAQQITARAGAHNRREQVMALRDYLRRHVKWRGAAREGRPFLRATARETLESVLGYCGESTRAFIQLAHQLGIRAHRVALYGTDQHVIAEVEVRPGLFILVDPQDSPPMNAYFDRRDWTLDTALRDHGCPFSDYSNLSLRRVPILDQFVSRVKLRDGPLTRILEDPWLIRFYSCIILCSFMVFFYYFRSFSGQVLCLPARGPHAPVPPNVSRSTENRFRSDEAILVAPSG